MDKFEKLLASYDPVDVKYKSLFADKDKPAVRSADKHLFSFVPTREECKRILSEPFNKLN